MNQKKGLQEDDPGEFFRHVMQWSADIVVIADWHRNIIYANPAALEKTGYSKKELIGKKIPLLYQKDFNAKYTSMILSDLRVNGRWTGELEFQKKDGSTFTTASVVLSYLDKGGNVAGTINIARDQSDKRLLERKSMESESRLQSVLESMEDAVFVCNTQGKILMCNQAHSRMLGYSVEEIVGVEPPYPWVDPIDRKKMQQGFKLLVKEGSLRNYTVTWRCRTGKTMVASLAFSFLTDSASQRLGYVISVRDVSDVHHVEELRMTNERIQRLLTDIQHKAERLHVLEETHRLVLNRAEAGSIFRAIILSLRKLVDHDLAAVYVYDAKLDGFVAHTVSKQSTFTRKLSKFPLKMGEGIIGRAACSGEMVWVNNAQLDPRSRYPAGLKPEKEHFIAAPLKTKGGIYGILVVARNRDPLFIEEEAAVVQSFADAVTVALENSHLIDELTKDQRNISSALFPISSGAQLQHKLPKLR